MRRAFQCSAAWLLILFAGRAAIIDRIAVVVDNRVIKDSDIERDIRITDFLNGDRLDLSEPERKKSAQRLIDQQLIRREADVAGYSTPSPEEAGRMWSTMVKERYHDDPAQAAAALQKFGISEAQMRSQLQWQITVLHFIEQRFRPAVLVSDADIDKYLAQHSTEYRAQKPEDARTAVRELLVETSVNEAFEKWIARARKRTEIEFHEAGLQ